jgi:peroxiredoxin Q/BCP
MVKISNKVWTQSVPLTDGSEQSLSDCVSQLLVVYFYPRANTPGCSNESKDFSAEYAAFQTAGCQVLGISQDSLKKQQNFKNKYDMPFELVADEAGILCEAFDVIKEKKMYGKTFMGIERSTFVLNDQGEVVAEWRKVKVPGHVAEVLTAVKEI